MNRILGVLLGLLLAGSAFAADNTVVVTPGSGVTLKSKDVGAGVQAMQPILSDTGGNPMGAFSNYGTSPGAVLAPGVNAFVTNTNANGPATAANSSPVVLPDPCQSGTKLYKPISITTNTTTNIITGTSAKNTYICHMFLTSAAADNVAIISGTTGATCGANTVALLGGTTATNGPNFPANGGFSIGDGGFAVLKVQTANDDVCIITSAATPLAGSVTYVIQ